MSGSGGGLITYEGLHFQMVVPKVWDPIGLTYVTEEVGAGGGGGDASAANQTTEIARLTSILAQLDVALSTRAAETTLAAVKTAVETIDNFIAGARGLVTEDSAVAILAGVGAPTDAEAAGNGSTIAVLKRLRTLVAGGLPAALIGGRHDINIGASSGNVPVDLSDEDTRILGRLKLTDAAGALINPATEPTLAALLVELALKADLAETQPVSLAIIPTAGGKTLTYVSVAQGAAGSLELAAASPGNKHKVLGAVLTMSADGTLKFTDTGDLTGAMDVAAKGGFVVTPGLFPITQTGAVNRALNLVTTVGAAKGVVAILTEP